LQEEILKKHDTLSDQEVWAGTITDISEPEFFKQYISESEKRFKNITEGLPIIIWVTDENDYITYFNKKAEDFFDIKKGDRLSLSAFGEAIHPAEQEESKKEWRRLKMLKQPIHAELLVRDRTGKERYLATKALPRILPNGHFVGYIAATYDLSKEFEYKKEMEAAYRLLQSSEQKYRSLFENMQLGVLEVDQQENILYANDAFLKITGYQFDDIKGKVAGELFCGDKESKEILSKQQKIRQQGIESAYEIQLRRKNNELATVIISGAPLFDKSGLVRGSVGIHWDVTEVRNLEKRLHEEKLTKEKELTEAKLQAEEEQRTQIGRDLHDGVGQVLAYLSLRLGLARMKSSTHAEELQELEQSARSALEQVRLLSRTLAPPALRDLGLRDAVIELVDSYDIIKKPVIKLKIYRQTEDYNLSLEKKVMVYRIIQELLANSLKYAQASNIYIELFFRNNAFHFQFSDDGIGFDLSKVKKGIGLESIQSRVAFYKGKVTLSAKPGKGNKVIIQLPLN
jgi:PAS domain S-box-containing protein